MFIISIDLELLSESVYLPIIRVIKVELTTVKRSERKFPEVSGLSKRNHIYEKILMKCGTREGTVRNCLNEAHCI